MYSHVLFRGDPSSAVVSRQAQRLEELEAENAELKQLVEEAAKSTAQSHRRDAVATPSTASKVSGELVNQRLKEMFRKNVDQFKEAVRSLFGYELIFSPGTHTYQVKVRSIYAEAEDHFLQFEWVDGGDGKVDMAAPLQLMATPFAHQLQRDRPNIFKVYLKQFDSIPFFLSEVNRHLFESTTQFGQGAH